MQTSDLKGILDHFQMVLPNPSFSRITNGYINDTFLVSEGDHPRFVLQRVNTSVFTNVQDIQENCDKISKVLQQSNYQTIDFVKTQQGNSLLYLHDDVWRLMRYIPESQTFNSTTKPKIALEAGKLIGQFHRDMAPQDTSAFHIAIPNFHHLPSRLAAFRKALTSAPKEHSEDVAQQVAFVSVMMPILLPVYQNDLPLRVCHNDTKLNNMLFDSELNAIALIDLDTIMPGFIHYDIGDATRTIVNTAKEDEKDLSRITFKRDLYTSFVHGLHDSELQLSQQEIDQLPIATVLMPFLHGLRMLTDYLNGNVYYQVSYKEQNADRSASLFAFAQRAYEHLPFMTQCVGSYFDKKSTT